MSIRSVESTSAVSQTERASAGLRLPPRRTINRLALALVGAGIAALGQLLLSRDSLADGLLFFGVGAILFVRALGDRLYPARSKPEPVGDAGLPPLYERPAGPAGGAPAVTENSTMRRGWPRNLGLWLLLMALGISLFFELRFFDTPDSYPQGWALYLSSLVMLVAGGLLLTRGRPRPRSRRSGPLTNRQVVLALSVIVGLAALLRLYNLDGQPFGIWYDEAEAGLQARRILQVPLYRPVFYPPINVTGHLLTLYASALNWLGDNITSMRLVSVLFGTSGILAAYLFGRELRGPRFGLALAFLLAAARWHINFSRIAMTGVDAPFFEFLSLYFLVRIVKFRQARDGMWAGLTLGCGLLFYTAFRLFVVAVGLVGLFVIVGAITWWPWLSARLRNGGWRRWLEPLSLLVLSAWLVVVPVAKFAQDNSAAFWFRTQQISIFNKRDQADLNQALWTSTQKHLLMFNYQGDNNGRHNLPGEPMLDPAMGVLAVLGLALAVARIDRPANVFFLLLFPLSLAGGIFSVDFEAPQSLRSIGVIPVAIYFIGLSVAALGREAEKALKPLPRAWLVIPAAGLAGFILFYNASTYFVRQATDFASWNAFSAPETITGRKMAELGPSYKYYMSPFLTNHPTIRFLAPAVTDQFPLRLPNALPIREPPTRPVALFLHPDDQWVFDQARQLYPGGAFEIATSQTEDERPVVYFMSLQEADLASVQGLALTYRAESDSGENDSIDVNLTAPIQTSRALNVNLTWPVDGPWAEEQDNDIVAEWRGVLYAPRYGPYSLRLRTPGPAKLEIDGNVVLEGQGEQLTGLPLAEGNHAIRLEAEVKPGQVALYWQPPGQGETLIPQWALYAPPVDNHGLLGIFYANDQWAGQPAFQRIDPFLDTYFHLVPLDRPYTVEWTGSLDVPQTGLYRLGLRAVQEAQLFIDGQFLVNTPVPNEYFEEAITLQAGLHDITVRYRDATDRSRIHLYWIPPNGRFEPIPSTYLWPPMGRYPPRPALSSDPAAKTEAINLRWQVTLGNPGREPGQFLEPRDLAVLPDGNLVVVDTVNRRVQILDPQGTPRQILSGEPFPFEEPLAVEVNSRGEILVLDSTLQWIYRYTPTGEFVDRFGGPNAYLFHPRGLTVFEDDTVAVADTGNARIVFFDPDGVQAGNIGGLGGGPGQFNEPTDVLRDTQGTYFVAEAENNRIQRVDLLGNPLGQWAIPPAYAFNGPHMTFGPDGSLLITESGSHSLLRYALDGTLLDQWQTIGPITLALPVGIYFDETTGQLYVTDVRTHQIHVFTVQTAAG